MEKDYLDINETTKLCTMDYDVKLVIKYDNYYYIKLENEQSFVTDGIKLYDTSSYDFIKNVFFMSERLCAVCCSLYGVKLIDLNTEEILFYDKDANDLIRKDDQVLCVFRSCGPDTLYNIYSKKYLYDGSDYKYDYSLGNGYYLFEEIDSEKKYCDLKHRIINSNGDIVFDNIEGYPHIKDNHLIITKNNVMNVITFFDKNTFISKEYMKGEKILADPIYEDGKIILVEKEFVRFYSLNNSLLKEIKIDGLEFVVDSQYVNAILKLCVASSKEESAPTRHVFLNVKTGKVISHFRIEGYPYWIPKYFVGFESYNDVYKNYEEDVLYERTNYHFYDFDFNKIACIKGNKLKELDLEDLFHIQTWNGKEFDNVFLNATSRVIKPCIYDTIVFKSDAACGYAISSNEDRIDIVDLNLNVMVDHVDERVEFGRYYIWDTYLVNDYTALILSCDGGYGTLFRTVLFNPDREVIMDSFYKVFPLDNSMQLMGSDMDKTLFLNTKTGEIKPLTITAKADEFGFIDFKDIGDFRNLLPNDELFKLEEKNNEKVKINKYN